MPPHFLFRLHPFVYIVGLSALLFIPFLGNVHLFDLDEVNFAECSREMILTNEYTRVQIDFQPFYEKPPLFFWMQTIAMKIFGINEFAARLPNAICGIITLLVVFTCGKKVYGKKLGIYWALAYAGSLFPNMYFKSGIIDPWFNLFTFLSIYYLILYHWKRNGFDKEGLTKNLWVYAVWSGVFMGLAILMKGPAALIVFLLLLVVYFIYNRFRFYFGWGHTALFLVVTILVTLAWYGYETIKNGTSFFNEFLEYQYRLFTTHDAGQKGFHGYHFIVILIGCFPASLFAIPSFFKTGYSHRFDKDFKNWMIFLFWVVLILFTFVQSRIVHYSSLAWFPVTFLAAYSFYKWEMKEMTHNKYTALLLSVIGGFIALLLIAIPILAMNIQKLIPYVKDKFAQANMEAEVNWTGWESVAGILLIVTIIIGLRKFNRKDYVRSAWVFFCGTALVVFSASALIVPRIEKYSQGAAVEFFKLRQGEDCYVKAIGYKSYADLFYTQKAKPLNKNSHNLEWLLAGKIDKPVYFVTKLTRLERFSGYTELKELYRKNGFVFLKREKPSF